MQLNRYKIKLAAAYPDLRKEKESKNRTFRGFVGVEDNTKRQAYIKQLSLSQLSREALLTVMGRMLALPIPEPYYVDVNPAYMGMSEQSTQHLIAFGLEAEQVPAQRILQENVLQNIGNWSEVYKCAAFDALIGNRDRIPHNLLFAGNNAYWLIDHEEALPSHMDLNEAVGTQLCQKIREAHSNDLGIYRARDRMLSFIETINDLDWDMLIDALRLNEMTEIQPECLKLISFLQDRIPKMREILTKELHIKQQELAFPVIMPMDKKESK